MQTVLKGALFGVIATLGICLLMGTALYVWMWSAGLGSKEGFFLFSAEALVVGAVAGGLVGRALAIHF